MRASAHTLGMAPHTRESCDESCRYCAQCYQASGYEVCGRLCEHADDEEDEDHAPMSPDEAHAGECPACGSPAGCDNAPYCAMLRGDTDDTD